MFYIDKTILFETEHEAIRDIYAENGDYDAINDQVRGIIRFTELLLSKEEKH